MEDQTAPPFPEEVEAKSEVNKPVTSTETVVETKTTTAEVNKKPRYDTSHVFQISVRSFCAMIIIGTVCFMAIQKLEVTDPLYSISLIAVGFLFGSSTNKPKIATQ